jgi:hypothetical protein
MNPGPWLVAAGVSAALAAPCAAQTGERTVAVKAGLNIERAEDGLKGQSPAVGVALVVPLTQRWAVDVDYWHPAFFETGPGVEHRDLLLSFGARASFGERATRPFLLFGAGIAGSQFRRPERNSAWTGMFLYGGFGAETPIGRRLSLVPELRMTLDAAFVVVRPSIGVAWRF